MNLYPAIDILGGSAVRLVRGDFDSKRVYDEDPLSAARGFAEAGARSLHVVDLDGAKGGAPINLGHLRRICADVGLPVQYGGGLRSAVDVAAALDAGAVRVVLGTVAFSRPELLSELLAEHGPERVLVSLDARAGRVAVAGWTETTELAPADVLERLQERGVRLFVYTDVDRDGMLSGPALDQVRELAARAPAAVIYSGGIGALADLKALARLDSGGGLEGVIVGKALYEGRFTVRQGLAALSA